VAVHIRIVTARGAAVAALNRLKCSGVAIPIALLVSIAAGCTGCGGSEAGELIAAYTRAACVQPTTQNLSERNPTRTWGERFDLGPDVAVSIDASCSAGGSVMGKYSDEPEPRAIAGGGDSMSPCDLRIDWMQMRLYVRAEGPQGASRTRLYEYDLQARRSARESDVDPAILPPRCEMK
jgi:hypothetical protein